MDWADHLGSSLDLAALRARRTPTVKTGRRGQAYTTGLSQAQELWKAANDVSTLASPILRYYALMQASRAIAAASDLPNQSWEPGRSHGLSLELERPSGGRRLEFSDVRISLSGDGMAQRLAAALHSPMIADGTTLDALIAGLWHQRYQPEPAAAAPLHPRRTLAISVTYGFDRGPTEAHIYGALSRTNQSLSEASTLGEFLIGYPGLSRLGDYEARWKEDPEFQLVLAFDKRSPMAVPAAWREIADVIDTSSGPGWQTEDLMIFFPPLGAERTTIHPLLCWYLVLYSFSMLARYYGDLWRRRLDLDKDPDAVELAALVDNRSEDSMALVSNAIRSLLRASSAPAD